MAARIAGGDKGRLTGYDPRDKSQYLTVYDLSEFDENETFGVGFADEAELERRRLYIQAQNVSKEMCKRLKAITGDGTHSIMGVDGLCPEGDEETDLDIVFNEDLSPNVRAIICGDDGGACAGCQKCEDGICVDDDSKCPTGARCSQGICACPDGGEACSNGGVITCCAAGQICDKGTCKILGEGDCTIRDSQNCTCPDGSESWCRVCTSNADCIPGPDPQQEYFCDVAGSTTSCTPAQGYCRVRKEKCEKTAIVKDQKVCVISRQSSDNRIGTQSGVPIGRTEAAPQGYASWWAAQNECEARGGHIASLAELDMAADYNSCVEENSGIQEYCHEYWLGNIPGGWSGDNCGYQQICRGMGITHNVRRLCSANCCKSKQGIGTCLGNGGWPACNELGRWMIANKESGPTDDWYAIKVSAQLVSVLGKTIGYPITHVQDYEPRKLIIPDENLSKLVEEALIS